MAKWPAVREAIKHPTEDARRFSEGRASWDMWGDPAEKDAVEADGVSFRALWEAEEARRKAVRDEQFKRGEPLWAEYIAEGGEDDVPKFSRWKWKREAVASGRWGQIERDREEIERLGIDEFLSQRDVDIDRQEREREEARRRHSDTLRHLFHGKDYDALGLPATASPDEVRQAYRRLAAKHHPDKGGDSGEFVRVRKAYERLALGAAP